MVGSRPVAGPALLLTAMAGRDPDVPFAAEADARRTDYASGLTVDILRRVRLGVVRKRVGDDERVAEVFSA